jgi:hypothetical protein
MDKIQGTENALENAPPTAFPTTPFAFQTFAK